MRITLSLLFFIVISISTFACELTKVKASLAKLTWVTEDYPPYNYIDANGQLTGIFTDSLVLIYQTMGIDIDVKDIAVIPWARLYNQLTYEHGVGGFSMTTTVERSKRFKLVSIPYSDKISIMVRRDRKEELSQRKFEDMRIGVVREDIGHHLLNFYNIPAVQVHTSSAQSMLKMLLHNRVDAIAYSEAVAHFQFKKMNIGPDDIVPFHLLSENKGNNFVFHRDTDECVTKLFADTIADLYEDGKLDSVFDSYILKENF